MGEYTNYDFIASRSDAGLVVPPVPVNAGCNYWRRAGAARYPFGENSNTRLQSITDGTSNTFLIGEETVWVANGQPSPWAYRGWVQTGVDPNGGINLWYGPNLTPPLPAQIGRLRSWGQAGSVHSGGCFFAMADGSVRFVSENTSSTILYQSSTIADGTNPSLN